MFAPWRLYMSCQRASVTVIMTIEGGSLLMIPARHYAVPGSPVMTWMCNCNPLPPDMKHEWHLSLQLKPYLGNTVRFICLSRVGVSTTSMEFLIL